MARPDGTLLGDAEMVAERLRDYVEHSEGLGLVDGPGSPALFCRENYVYDIAGCGCWIGD